MPSEVSVKIETSILDVNAGDWDALLGPSHSCSPFVRHKFLASFESAGVLGRDQGWIPHIVTVRRGRQLVAAVPCYIKTHSMGEFVFDWAWAELYEKLMRPYYPKLLVGVPFTPATGRRFLTVEEDRDELILLLSDVLKRLCQKLNFSSVHANFLLEDEFELLSAAGFIPRLGVQYHWSRSGEEEFEGYLSRFKSKHRNQIRREIRAMDDQCLQAKVLRGDALRGKGQLLFELYKSTIDKLYWGRQYLNQKIFDIWCETMPDELELMAALDGERVIAGAINFLGQKRLYGRYWGCFEEKKHLHFNVCYYEGVKRCLALGLDFFEPGAGGEHKRARGFLPAFVRSAHYLVDAEIREVLAQYLSRERRHLTEHVLNTGEEAC